MSPGDTAGTHFILNVLLSINKYLETLPNSEFSF